MYSREVTKFLKKLCINNTGVIASAITEAARSNTYVETVNPHISDGLHWNLARNYPETLTTEFFAFTKSLLRKCRIGSATLIVDITEENFYGDHAGLFLHGWTGERGVVAKFQYFVVSALFRNKIIPFYVAIFPVGGYKAEYIGKAVQLCKTLGIQIREVLLDRGFYSGDMLNTLQLEHVKYLVFVPKNKWVKRMLAEHPKDCVLEHEIKYTQNKRSCKTVSDHVFFHQKEEYAWVFATNISFTDVKEYVSLYKKRWNIETMFRVHDEARIKTKSIKPEIRLFYFLIGMLFLLVWNLYHKEKVVFKQFLIRTYKELEQIFVHDQTLQ